MFAERVMKHMFYTPETIYLLDPDTDEVLLLLLARDTEPIYKPDKPHRRYVQPEYLGTISDRVWGYIEKPDGEWTRIADDWWIKEGDSYGATSQ